MEDNELKRLRKLLSYQPDKTDWWGEERELIALEVNDCLNNLDKKLKALEIIKEKKVYPSFLLNTKNLEEYNYETIQKLTKEEYELLKEILK